MSDYFLSALTSAPVVTMPKKRAITTTTKPAPVVAMSLEQALMLVRASGYYVSKPRAPRPLTRPLGLNAIGKPYGANYDPKYRVRHTITKCKREQKVGDGISSLQWERMCIVADLDWQHSLEHNTPLGSYHPVLPTLPDWPILQNPMINKDRLSQYRLNWYKRNLGR